MRAPDLSPAEERSRAVLDVLMRLFGRTNEEVAEVLGVKWQAVQQRRKGGTRIRQQDVEDLAVALGVPASLFRSSPADAVGWVAEHQRDLIDSGVRNRWFALGAA